MLIYRKPRKIINVISLNENPIYYTKDTSLVPIDKVNDFFVIRFPCPEVVGTEGQETVQQGKERIAVVLPRDVIINGAQKEYVNVEKGTSQPQESNPAENLRVVTITDGDVRKGRSAAENKEMIGTTYLRPDHICSIEPGTMVKVVGFIRDADINKIDSKGFEILLAIEQFTGNREITIFHKDKTIAYGGSIPAVPEQTDANSNLPKKNESRKYRISRYLYEGLSSSYILALELETR